MSYETTTLGPQCGLVFMGSTPLAPIGGHYREDSIFFGECARFMK